MSSNILIFKVHSLKVRKIELLEELRKITSSAHYRQNPSKEKVEKVTKLNKEIRFIISAISLLKKKPKNYAIKDLQEEINSTKKEIDNLIKSDSYKRKECLNTIGNLINLLRKYEKLIEIKTILNS